MLTITSLPDQVRCAGDIKSSGIVRWRKLMLAEKRRDSQARQSIQWKSSLYATRLPGYRCLEGQDVANDVLTVSLTLLAPSDVI